MLDQEAKEEITTPYLISPDIDVTIAETEDEIYDQETSRNSTGCKKINMKKKKLMTEQL